MIYVLLSTLLSLLLNISLDDYIKSKVISYSIWLDILMYLCRVMYWVLSFFLSVRFLRPSPRGLFSRLQKRGLEIWQGVEFFPQHAFFIAHHAIFIAHKVIIHKYGIGITEKKIGPIMSNFWGQFFHVFKGKKKDKKNEDIIASALKSCIIWS